MASEDRESESPTEGTASSEDTARRAKRSRKKSRSRSRARKGKTEKGPEPTGTPGPVDTPETTPSEPTPPAETVAPEPPSIVESRESVMPLDATEPTPAMDLVEGEGPEEGLELISLDDLDDLDEVQLEETILAVAELAGAGDPDMLEDETVVVVDADPSEDHPEDEPAATPVAATPEAAELSSPEARARLVAQALAHAEAKDARYRLPMGPAGAGSWKAAGIALLLLTASYVAIRPPALVVPAPVPLPDRGDRIRGAQVALHLQARQIEVFRLLNDRLPLSLQELPTPIEGIRFVRSDDRAYQLVAYGPSGQPVVFDSASPAPVFDSIAASLGSLEEGS